MPIRRAKFAGSRAIDTTLERKKEVEVEVEEEPTRVR